MRNDCTTQEPRRAVRITRLFFEIPILCLRCRWLKRNSTKNLTKIDENGTKIDEKSMQNRSWEVLGARSRFGDAPGRARDGSGTPKKDPGIDLWGVRGGPRAHGNRSKVSPGRSRDAPGQLRSGPRARLVRRALSNTLAERFCIVFVASCRSSKLEICAPTQCFVSLGQCTHRPRASVEKPRKSSGFGLRNRARECPSDPKSSPGGPVRAKKCGRSASGASENF